MLNKLKAFIFNYSNQPKVGDKIRITWLPYNNAWPTKNCYIGWEGEVTYLYDNGGFVVSNGNGMLCVTRNKYKYKLLK